MNHSCRLPGLSYFGFIVLSLALSLMSGVGEAEASESAAIQATARVEQPIGILVTPNTDTDSPLTLYCPQQGHLICSITYLTHLAQLQSGPVVQSAGRTFSFDIAGQIASLAPASALFSDRGKSDAGCIVTLIYTEN